MKSAILFLFLNLFVLNVWAVGGDFSCPETHPEYTKLLSEIKSFQAKLKENLNCQEVAVKFDKITSLLGAEQRQEILSLVAGNSGQSLTVEAAEKIQNYTGAITEEVGVLISLIGSAASGEGSIWDIFTGTNRCELDEADGFDGIERLTKAAYEATNLVSKVAGPYGVPLQIGVSAFYLSLIHI